MHSAGKGQEEGGPGSNTLALPLLHAPPLYDLVVKVQLLCWASELSARSFVPVVITPLYLVLLARRVVLAPKGFRVAVSPSELRLTTTSVICVWVPSVLASKSLKVVVLTVEAPSSQRRWPSGWFPGPRAWPRSALC